METTSDFTVRLTASRNYVQMPGVVELVSSYISELLPPGSKGALSIGKELNVRTLEKHRRTEPP